MIPSSPHFSSVSLIQNYDRDMPPWTIKIEGDDRGDFNFQVSTALEGKKHTGLDSAFHQGRTLRLSWTEHPFWQRFQALSSPDKVGTEVGQAIQLLVSAFLEQTLWRANLEQIIRSRTSTGMEQQAQWHHWQLVNTPAPNMQWQDLQEPLLRRGILEAINKFSTEFQQTKAMQSKTIRFETSVQSPTNI